MTEGIRSAMLCQSKPHSHFLASEALSLIETGSYAFDRQSSTEAVLLRLHQLWGSRDIYHSPFLWFLIKCISVDS